MRDCRRIRNGAGAALIAGAIAIAGFTNTARAQSAEAGCTYESCALSLAPVWNGLAITRGISQRQVANLGYFWPSDIRPVFADNAAALEAADEALQTRTVAAVLTDAGLVLLATGLARAAFQREFDGFARVLVYSGTASIGISVPVHFAADGMLNRAIWWHNRRYSR
ncbi:MAG: hypothetical protein ACSLFK_06410 [Gemmatimonadaceae bacterium]